MSGTVPRTCTVVPEPSPDGNRKDIEPPQRDSRPLADFRSHDAYVLLGDPGAGKTTAFEDEAELIEAEASHLVSARDFLAIKDPTTVPLGKTLFIDGLDEVRAGERNARTPFDAIRQRLHELGRPRFRLSCREADWLGENDRRHLAKVSPGKQVTVLRLDPLTEAEIRKVLESRDDIPDPAHFMFMAHDRGVDGLLANPQTLGMLADVVGEGGEWPRSRLETFEQSCRRIADEHNKGHKIALLGSGGPPDVNRILDAAGHLCALHLLTGTAGFSMLPAGHDADWLSPDQCDYEPPDLLRHALRTKLFRGQPDGADGRVVPVHRHVAEYLAARHLGRLVEERKLPARRGVALMAGDDGTVVTEMRGLSAWFAARCHRARSWLIDRDPIGVVQYGDVGGFTDGEKRSLLGALERDLPMRAAEFGFAARLRALATPGMETALKDVLSGPSRDPERQRFVGPLLQALIDGAALPGLSESLLRVARDPTWRSSVRVNALKAYGRSLYDHDRSYSLRTLLTDIRRGKVDDPDDDLLGTLLEQLYPSELAPHELWEFFAEPRNPDHYGAYVRFWASAVVDGSPDADVPEHLDHLSQQPRSLQRHPHSYHLRRLRLGLLARGLSLRGDHLVRRREIARLYDWLGVASASHTHLDDHDGHAEDIRAWLAERPQVQKAVILECLTRLPDDALAPSPQEVQERLYGSALPSDFGLWCLDQALAIEHETPRAAEYLLERAFRALEDDRINRGLSLSVIQERTRDSDHLKAVLAQSRRSRNALASSESEFAGMQSKYEREQKEKRRRELSYLRSQESALAENQASHGLLYQLARIYFSDFRDIAADKGAGARAIEARCAGDRSLTEAILASFRGVPSREDVPKLRDIVRACRENRIYHLGLPFLAGLAELERVSEKAGAMGPDKSDASMRLAVAFLLTTIHGVYRPSWYQTLLSERPEMVADVQVRIASAAWKGNESVDCKLYELAFDSAHKRVARFSALRLLRAFPTQCRRRYAQELEYVLIAALQHSDGEALRELINAKLSRSSLGVWQRVRWLAAGWFAWPDSYADALWHHVKERKRWKELTTFVSRTGQVADLVNGLESASLAFLVRLLGSSVSPERYPALLTGRTHVVTPIMERCRMVRGLIHRLASSRSREAGDLLEELAGDSALRAWQVELRRAREAQRAVRRDHGYRHPGVQQVCRTLRGAEPANVADLAVLVEDHLRQFGNEIRHGDADGWTLFWNQDPHGRATVPKPENACRDALLVALQSRLPQSLEVAREAHHARHNRSDLRVSYLGPMDQRFHVPVEVKKDEHSDLWTSIYDQLVGKYAIDPAANGFGIYLVLWFGRRKTRRSPDGERPAGPENLEECLRDTLSPRQARKISVRVIDVGS